MIKLWSEQLTFTLPNQRKVDLQAFSLKFTYDGVLEATITERVNKRVLGHLEFPAHWRDDAIHVEWPTDLSEMLPAFVCFAELVSFEPISTPDQFSELNYVWFLDSIEGIPLRDLIQKALDRLDWDGLAKEREYDF
jgi:hypothetical protein